MSGAHQSSSSRSAGGSSDAPQMFRPSKPEDWEPYRDVIAHLYTTMKLKDVMVEMQTRHQFKATEKQYKTQLKKWSLDTKYTKASEYMAMIQTKRRRENENPPKQTRFILRGRPVDPKDITRFEKRAMKKGTIMSEEEIYAQGPIEDLVCETPSPEPSGAYSEPSQYQY
ncbi:Clr5 domain-containing protein [Diplogelasinospora grovesii]|uniref:Clr5 domain-containing protein n=1 Tax=Diplogelasinospora grovesii TaxID=303347 RepID=A0AAN6N4S5_9PEZI|nr:Clr5 domain-containing protein [Diplogelasinospora grovesii]